MGALRTADEGGVGMRAPTSLRMPARIGKGQRFFVRSTVDARSML